MSFVEYWAGIDADNIVIARGYTISFESPKNSKFSLFQHGEKAYDHLLILPPKSKGWTTLPNHGIEDNSYLIESWSQALDLP